MILSIQHACDVLIVGSGAAGLSVALSLADHSQVINGPKTSCPKMSPAKMPKMTHKILAGSDSSKSIAICPMAGNIMSIASAIVAIKKAASAINSRGLAYSVTTDIQNPLRRKANRFTVCDGIANQGFTAMANTLVSVDWLHQHLDDAHVIVLDASYHLPTAKPLR